MCIPTGLASNVMHMYNVPSATDNNTNYSINSQDRNGNGNIANYSVNNQGRDGTSNITNSGNNPVGYGTSNNTNNSGNNHSGVATGNDNDNANTPVDRMERENNILQEFHRRFGLVSVQGRETIHLQTTLDNSRSLEAAHREQLNEPNLSQEETRRLQLQCQRLARQSAIFREQLERKQREYSQNRQELDRLEPLYHQIMMQDLDNE